MRGEINKFDDFTKIYSLFTEENKTTIFQTAKSLLKIQKRDIESVQRVSVFLYKTEKEAGKND